MTDGVAPTDVFGLLADETRLNILRELAAYQGARGYTKGLTFAELRKTVGVDDAGRFNYHLNQLRGPLVFKQGEEYLLRNAGFEIVGAMESGAFHERSTSRTATTSHRCPSCGDSLDATYGYEIVEVTCPTHGMLLRIPLPTEAAVDRSMDRVVDLANKRGNRQIRQLVDTTCPYCLGAVEVTVPIDADRSGLWCRFTCRTCWLDQPMGVGVVAVTHPAVVSLYHRHGHDVQRDPSSSFEVVFETTNSATTSADPRRVTLDITLDDDEVMLTLDDELRVVDVEQNW